MLPSWFSLRWYTLIYYLLRPEFIGKGVQRWGYGSLLRAILAILILDTVQITTEYQSEWTEFYTTTTAIKDFKIK